MTPLKTEYRNVLFDSKSEAVFARTLDLAGCDWFYHPAEYCGHEWDFLVVPPSRQVLTKLHLGGHQYVFESWSQFKPMLVEYKPARPSNTYIDSLTERMSADPFESLIVWGNPFADDQHVKASDDGCYIGYPVFSSFDRRCGWGDFNYHADASLPAFSTRHEVRDILGITAAMPAEAKSFRFDLHSDAVPRISGVSAEQLKEFQAQKEQTIADLKAWSAEFLNKEA